MKRHVVIPVPGGPASSPSSSVPTVLEIKQMRERSARLVVASHERVVCRFWTEKLLVAVDALQLYALLWQLSQPWPWPARWLAWTRWTNAFNVDVFSFRARGAAMGATSQSFSLWGEMHHYWLYALGFGAAPILLLVGFVVITRRWEVQGRDDFLARRFAWANALVHVLYMLYLPVGLAVLRLVNYDANGHVCVDPETFPTCWSITHTLAVVGITCGVGGSFLLGFPFWLRHTIKGIRFTDDNEDHERFLKSTELAYVLRVSDAYLDLYMPQVASFQVHAVQSLADMCLVKLVLLAIFSLLRSPSPSTANQGLQGNLFFAVLLVVAWRLTWHPVFRLDSTNQLAKLLAWLLVSNGIVALLCANGVRSALTVSTSVTTSLSFLNLVVLSTLALSLGQSLRQWVRRGELIPLPGARILAPFACWPTHPFMDEIVSDQVLLEEWITLIQEMRALSLQTAVAAPTVKPFHELAIKARELEASWREAKASDHLLAVHLRQELLLITDLYVDAMATSPFKDGGLQSDHQSEFASLADRLRRRDDDQMLLPAASRRVLSKLQAASIWSPVHQPVDCKTHPI